MFWSLDEDMSPFSAWDAALETEIFALCLRIGEEMVRVYWKFSRCEIPRGGTRVDFWKVAQFVTCSQLCDCSLLISSLLRSSDRVTRWGLFLRRGADCLTLFFWVCSLLQSGDLAKGCGCPVEGTGLVGEISFAMR